jgi:hydrogenase-4 transcriptional activator
MLLRARDDAYLTRLSTVKPHNPASHSLGVVRQFPVDAEALALCGDSLASKMLAKQLSSAANRDGPVVWVGEPHTWKRHYARTVWQASRWADEPLHALTGHTVTVHDLRMATMFGGSILLAHLDDAPLAVQDLVLAVLDTPGLRFIFPSNTDLLDVSRRGTMRRPLAARLASASIWMPPLRERLEDLPLMARQRVADVTANGGALRALSAESVRRIAQYPWGGNRAELRTTIQRAVFLSQGPVLEVRPRQSLSRRRPIAKPLDPVIRDAVRDALTQTEWTIEGPNGAASLLGMPASTLRSKMKKLTIQR